MRRLRRLDQRHHELRLIVEHLLEVRHAPPLIDRVAMEAAADVIAQAALGHRAERRDHHVAEVVAAGGAPGAQQEQQLRRPRKLRRAAETAVAGVEGAAELIGRLGERLETGDVGAGVLARRVERHRRQAIDHERPTPRAPWAARRVHTRSISRSRSTKPGRPHRPVGGK